MNKTSLMTLACLALVASAGCDLSDKDIGEDTMGADTKGDDPVAGGDCMPDDTEPVIPAGDGCNTCVCQDDGTYACTELACEDPGEECEPGSTVPSADGCNTCECNDDGTLGSCTEIDCDPDPDPKQECEPGEVIDDGCNTCFCEEDGTISGCTDNVCECDCNDDGMPDDCSECDPGDPGEDTDPFDGPDLSSCMPSTPMDDLAVTGFSLNGDILTLEVAYSGCGPGHPLGGCWDGTFLEIEPVQIDLTVAHDNLGEECAAFPSDSVDIDLTPLREAYVANYGAGNGIIDINVAGLEETVQFSF